MKLTARDFQMGKISFWEIWPCLFNHFYLLTAILYIHQARLQLDVFHNLSTHIKECEALALYLLDIEEMHHCHSRLRVDYKELQSKLGFVLVFSTLFGHVSQYDAKFEALISQYCIAPTV